MKKSIYITAIFAIIGFSLLSFSSCLFNKKVYEPPRRVKLVLPEKFRVEYQNNGDTIGGDSEVRTPGYCIVVKDGDLYYTKVPNVYQSNRLEVMRKDNLKNPVVFDTPEYSQGYITATWVDANSNWLVADRDDAAPNAPHWHANDKNNHVYYVAISFLNHGYGNINHMYENGVANSNGHKYTATQKDDASLLVGDKNINCIVWEYEAYFSDDNWKREKYWLEKDSNIVLKKNSIFPTSLVQDIDDSTNINLKATYFSKGEAMDDYLESIERNPAPDFSQYK